METITNYWSLWLLLMVVSTGYSLVIKRFRVKGMFFGGLGMIAAGLTGMTSTVLLGAVVLKLLV